MTGHSTLTQMAGVKNGSQPISRKQRAEATRQRIVEAALAAFTEHGYATTTVEAVARDAGVAVQTVYFAFRTKGDLLQAVYEHVVLGPEQLPPHLTPWWRDAHDEPDVVAAVRILVTGSMELLVRAAPLVWTVLGDETARQGYQFNEGLRRDGTEILIETLSAKHPLAEGMTPERARDVYMLLTGPQIYAQLARDLKWSREDIVSWTVSAILHQLFDIG